MRYLPKLPSRPSNFRGMERVARPLKPRPEHMRLNRQNISPPISRLANSSTRVLPSSHQQPLATKLKQGYISSQRQPIIQRLLKRASPMISSGLISGLGIMGHPQRRLSNFLQEELCKEGTKTLSPPLHLLGPLQTNSTRIRCSSEVTNSRLMVPITITTSDISPSPCVLFNISLYL